MTFTESFLSKIIKFALQLGLLAHCTFIQAQEVPFLVPYNDHGLWGFSDTLGTMAIKGQFQDASGFYKLTIGKKKHYLSNVKTPFGKNLYSYQNGLLLPDTAGILSWNRHDFEEKYISKRIYTLKEGEKYGLYHFQFEYILAPIYDTIVGCGSGKLSYLVKRNITDSTYYHFFPSSGSYLESDICSVKIYRKENGFERVFFATHLDSTYSFVDGSGLRPAQLDSVAQMEVYRPAESNQRKEHITKIKEDLEKQPNFGGELVNYIALPQATRNGIPGYNSLHIIKKKDAMGVVDDQGREIIPFDFDEIMFIGRGKEAKLIKENKVGRKLFTSHYPIIPAKYDEISLAGYLKVREDWSFAFFMVFIDGRKGMVGENGVEYFNFK